MYRFYLATVLAVTFLLVGRFAPVFAATLPPDFRVEQVISGLTQPTAMEFAPDGRLFVCEQRGTLRVITFSSNGAVLLPTPFTQVPTQAQGERGLLGVTFDPAFSSNHFVYVYYTISGSPPHNRVSRFTANGNTAAGSETVILELDPLTSAQNHNGGAIHFGTDGKLYIGVGENAQRTNAQTLTNLLGKILRINPDGSVPNDNPFVGQVNSRGEIWSYGFRNPFTFAINPGNGSMYVNDVGEQTWEEINIVTKGENYGWPDCEGSCSNNSYKNPIYQYDHSIGSAITGGTFYTGNQFPSEYSGNYFFADYTKDWIRRLNPNSANAVSVFVTGIENTVDLKTGPDGALYALAIGSGNVYRVVYGSAPTTGACSLKQTGDADCDGFIRLADFEVWRREFTANLGSLHADYDVNGRVTLGDFEIWRRSFTQSL